MNFYFSYRQFAPYFEEFSKMAYKQAKTFDPLFADALIQRTPASTIMMNIRETYSRWHLECVVKEKAEKLFEEMDKSTIFTGCNEILPDILDRLKAIELFETKEKRDKITKKLDKVLNYVKKSVRVSTYDSSNSHTTRWILLLLIF